MTNNLLNLKPKLSRSKSSIYVNIDNIKVAQVEYKEGSVGLTYIDFGKKGAKCYMDVRGGWPAYINTLSTNHKQHINGINISGTGTEKKSKKFRSGELIKFFIDCSKVVEKAIFNSLK